MTRFNEITAEVIIADKIVPMDEFLNRIGHPYHDIPGSVRCPVHAGGMENTPSARLYGKHDSLFCYACNKQYRITEIASSVWGVSRHEAAVKLLEIWVPTEDQRQEALRQASAFKKPTLDVLLQVRLERCLRNFKRRIPLELYRRWAEAVNDFEEHLLDIPKEYQPMAVESFIDRLNVECRGASK